MYFISGNCQKKSDIVFVLDQSGSIVERNPTNGSWDNWQLIKNFVITFMQNATVSYDGIHFGLVTFGNIAVKRFYLNDYYNIDAMTAAVQAIQPGNGETNTWAGLNMMRTQIFNPNNGARPDVPHIAIVITDGFANINTPTTIPEAEQAYSDGIRVYVIGMTNLINETQLQLISSPPQIKGQNYWTTPDYSSLSSVMGSIANETCSPPKTVYPSKYSSPHYFILINILNKFQIFISWVHVVEMQKLFQLLYTSMFIVSYISLV